MKQPIRTAEELINNATSYTYDHSYDLGESVLLVSDLGDIRVYSDGKIITNVDGYGATAQFTDEPDLTNAKHKALGWIARAEAVKKSIFKSISFEDHIPLTDQPALIEEASNRISEILNSRPW